MPNENPVVVNVPPSLSVQSNTPRAITQFSISDGDSESTPDQIYTVSIFPTHGTVTLGDNSGLTLYDDPILGTGTIGPNGEASFAFSSDESSLLFSGTFAAVNAALQTLTYTPDNGYTGPAIIEMTVMDAPPGGGPGATSDSETTTLSIGAVPAIGNLDGDSVTYAEGGAPIAVDANGDATVNGSDFTAATLRFEITANEVAAEDLLDIAQTGGVVLDQGYVDGGTVSVDGVQIGSLVVEGASVGNANTPGEAIVIVLNADADASAIARVVQAVTYVNLNVYEPSGATRTLVTTITRPDATVETFTSYIQVTPDDDDAPIVVDLDGTADGLSGTASFIEDAGAILLAPAAAVTDSAARDIAGGSLTITVAGADAFDQLGITDQGTGPGLIHVDGNELSEDGEVFATFTGGINGDPLVIAFGAENISSAHLETLYRAITYSSTSQDPQGDRTVTFTLDDGYLLGNPAPVSTLVTMFAAADAPVIDLNGAGESGVDSTASYTENADAAPLAPDLIVSDVDDTVLTGATVTISAGFDAADALLLDGNASGTLGDIAYSYDMDTGVLSLAGAASLADYQAALRLVGFESGSDAPGTSRTLVWALDDGTSTSSASTTLTITEANDAPTIASLEGNIAAYVEEEGPVYLDVNRDALVSDPDSGGFDGGVLTIAITGNKNFSEDVIAFDVDGTGIMIGMNDDGYFLAYVDDVLIGEMPDVYGAQGDDIQITFNADATADAISRLIQAVTYDNLNPRNPSTGPRAVEFTLSDGSGPDAATRTVHSFVTVQDVPEVNHAPVLDLNGATAGLDITRAYTENGAAFRVATGATVTDVDNYTYNGGSLTIAITDALTSDRLSLINQGQVRFYDNVVDHGGSIVGTFSGGTGGTPLVITFLPDASRSDTPAYTIADIVRAVAYSSSSENPPTSRTLTFTLDDGGGREFDGQLATATATINVTRTNDAVGLAIADTTVSGTEDTALIFNSANGNAITVSDPDGDTLTVTLTATNGTLTLSQTTNLTVTANGTASVQLVGSAADINAALNGLRYLGNTNFDGAASLSVLVRDPTGTTASGSIAITLADDGRINGDAGDNTLNGTAGVDVFLVNQAGTENLTGLGGNDGFVFGSFLDATDLVDGGAGTLDQVGLQGNYGTFGVGATPFQLGAGNLTNVEQLVLLSGSDTRFGDTAGNLYDYNLQMVDANVGAGQLFAVSFNTLQLGEDVRFDGSLETNGSFLTYGGLGTDTLIGGQQNDGFYFGISSRWSATDSVDGQGGTLDQLGLQGRYADGTAIVFGENQMTNIEMIVLVSGGDLRFGSGGLGYSYDLTMNDGNTASGALMMIQANTLRSDEVLTFNGSAELDGRFNIWAGAANDAITGGSGDDMILGRDGNDTINGGIGADTLNGGLGGDVLNGGAGNDSFVYGALTDSNSVDGIDGISDFTAGDLINLAAIDAVAGGANNAFTFIGGATFGGTGMADAGQLRASNFGGIWTVEGDVNGDGLADFSLYVVASTLTGADFVL